MHRNIAGKRVSAIGLGGMPMSIAGRPTEEQSIRVIKAALDAGTDFIDTANVYCLDDNDIGHNEKLIEKALRGLGKTNEVLVATKGGLSRPQGRWELNGRPDFLRSSCELSLKALNCESLFLYQLHAVDDNVPIEDSVGELARLQSEGKIQNIGLSNVDVEQIQRSREVANIVSVQNRCNPFYKRDFKNGVVDYCRDNEITYLPYSPVGGGSRHQSLAEDPLFTELSGKYNVSPYCVALAWLLSEGSHFLPIPGASKVASASDSPNAKGVQLEEADKNRIRELPE